MSYVKNNQESGATYDENHQIQNSVNSTLNDKVSFSNASLTDIYADISQNNSTSINTSYDVISTLNNQRIH